MLSGIPVRCHHMDSAKHCSPLHQLDECCYLSFSILVPVPQSSPHSIACCHVYSSLKNVTRGSPAHVFTFTLVPCKNRQVTPRYPPYNKKMMPHSQELRITPPQLYPSVYTSIPKEMQRAKLLPWCSGGFKFVLKEGGCQNNIFFFTKCAEKLWSCWLESPPVLLPNN